MVGLLEPRLLAKTRAGRHLGALVAKFAKHRVESGIDKKIEETLPEGAATLIAIYDHADADAVHPSVTSVAKISVAEMNAKSVKDLKGRSGRGAGRDGRLTGRR